MQQVILFAGWVLLTVVFFLCFKDHNDVAHFNLFGKVPIGIRYSDVLIAHILLIGFS